MEAKKTTRKKAVSKPKADNKTESVKDIENKINGLPIVERLKLAGQLKNGKLNLNFML